MLKAFFFAMAASRAPLLFGRRQVAVWSSLAEQLAELRLEEEAKRAPKEASVTPPPLAPPPKEEASLAPPKEASLGKNETDVASLAATVAAIGALGLVLPTESLELAALAAAASGYWAVSRDDAAVGELVRTLGRLGESTVRKGLETAFGPPATPASSDADGEATRDAAPDAAGDVERTEPKGVQKKVNEVQQTVAVDEKTQQSDHQHDKVVVVRDRAVSDARRGGRLDGASSSSSSRRPSRPLRPRDAYLERRAATRELKAVDEAERLLRASETELRAVLAEKKAPVVEDQEDVLRQALDGIDVVRSTFRASRAATPAAERELHNLEKELRRRQASLRASKDDPKKEAKALQAIHHQLDDLARRRTNARARLASASVVAAVF
mmetsp:Transcript_7505/g.24756  ORF Transcript_7505/g.24756 Transcript_7505/m.24756 type:complete len:383 (+) Transcript_7505:4-1152(+)